MTESTLNKHKAIALDSLMSKFRKWNFDMKLTPLEVCRLVEGFLQDCERNLGANTIDGVLIKNPRICACGCKTNIEHKHPNARFFSQKHKDKFHNETDPKKKLFAENRSRRRSEDGKQKMHDEAMDSMEDGWGGHERWR